MVKYCILSSIVFLTIYVTANSRIFDKFIENEDVSDLNEVEQRELENRNRISRMKSTCEELQRRGKVKQLYA